MLTKIRIGVILTLTDRQSVAEKKVCPVRVVKEAEEQRWPWEIKHPVPPKE